MFINICNAGCIQYAIEATVVFMRGVLGVDWYFMSWENSMALSGIG
jgi:hypothetical protein